MDSYLSIVGRRLKKNALGLLLLGLMSAMAACGSQVSPSATPTMTESQKVVQIAERRIKECYKSGQNYLNTGKAIDCDTPLTNMFRDISKTTGIEFGNDTTTYIGQLREYLEARGIFMDYTVLPVRHSAMPNFYMAPVAREEQRRINLDGIEREVLVRELGDPIVRDFREEASGGALEKADMTRDGKIYLQANGMSANAHELWRFYETTGYEKEMASQESSLLSLAKAGNSRGFNSVLQQTLAIQEWKDAYDSLKAAGKREEDFADLYVAANSDITIAHGATHVYDTAKDPVARERNAKLQELLQLPEYNAQFMLDGYEILANALAWEDSDFQKYSEAGRGVMSCVASYINSHGDRPQPDNGIAGSGSRRLGALMRLPKLTRDQIYDAARDCRASFGGN